MPRVRNLATGQAWDVPVGHFSLSSSEYEALPERAPAPEPAQVADEVAAPARRPVARKSARKG